VTTSFSSAFLMIVASRIALAKTTKLKSPTIHGFRFHHYMYGLALIAVSIFIKSVFLYAIGIALVIDETFIFLFSANNWKWKDNYSKKVYFSKWSFIDALLAILIVFAFRNYLVSFL
jgi:hypothetical protein